MAPGVLPGAFRITDAQKTLWYMYVFTISTVFSAG